MSLEVAIGSSSARVRLARIPKASSSRASSITNTVQRAGASVAILAVGTMVLPSLAAAEILGESGISATVVNCRYLKPHDERTLSEIVGDHRNILVVEEGTVVNGFGAHMSAMIGEMDSSVRVVTHGVPDAFIDQAPRAKQLARLGLDARGIAQRASAAFGLESSRGSHLRAI